MSSAPIPQSDQGRKIPHGRNASVNVPGQDLSKASKQPVAPPSPQVASYSNAPDHGSKVHYTAFVRLPFPRASFEEPPLVDWDAVKDKQLWKLISKAPNSNELNWEQMAEKFGVGLSFLLMQAAWLYERHFEGMKKQMMRLGGSGASGTSSPARSGLDIGVGSTKLGSKGEFCVWRTACLRIETDVIYRYSTSALVIERQPSSCASRPDQCPSNTAARYNLTHSVYDHSNAKSITRF